ncbi:hypothetical protein NMG60_11030499 [Bertholletia excelsa]
MDANFQNLGVAANPPSSAFKNQGKTIQGGGAGDNCCIDTMLRLDSPGASVSFTSKGSKRKRSLIDESKGQLIGTSLSLSLGHLSSSSDSKGSSATTSTTMFSAKEADEESSVDLNLDFSLHLGIQKISGANKPASFNLNAPNKLPKVDLELSLSTGPTESDITSIRLSPSPSESAVEMPLATGAALFHKDEESTSLHTSKKAGANLFLKEGVREIHPSPTLTPPKSSVTCTSGITPQQQQQQQQQQPRNKSTKICQFDGCEKGARGASGLCIAHGGGRRCQKLGCHKGAEGRTAYCKAHGGGRRCEFLGCTKSAEGRTDFCIAHGGGRRCGHEGCTRAARGKSGLCIRHGGGKRCKIENCTKSAEGHSGLCISHGGGRRCQYQSCTKGAQGSTMYCKAHGGGKRCTFEGCTKGAEGSTPFCKGHGGGKRCSFQGGGVCPKSVHGGTLFCVAHGGGKRCAVAECTKSARGRTDFCVRHGGGRRCQFFGCGKSAQGSTDFCKAHGGGKRCRWGHPGSGFGEGDGACSYLARGKAGLCTSHGALLQDKRVHGGVTLGALVQDPKPSKPEKRKQIAITENLNITSNAASASFNSKQSEIRQDGGLADAWVSVPEGRVHGGSLLAKLTGNSLFCPSEAGKSSVTPPNWI